MISNLNEHKPSTLAALLGAGYPPGLGLDDQRLHAATGFGSAAAIRQARHLGKFPVPMVKVGKKIVVPLPALAAWLDKVSGLSEAPIPQPAAAPAPEVRRGRPRQAVAVKKGGAV